MALLSKNWTDVPGSLIVDVTIKRDT